MSRSSSDKIVRSGSTRREVPGRGLGTAGTKAQTGQNTT